MHPKSSSGKDTNTTKEIKHELSTYVTIILSQSLATGIFPDFSEEVLLLTCRKVQY